jgi:hypothetical protein
MWNVRAEGAGVSEVMATCGGGLQAVLGDHVGFVPGGKGATTLGESREVTLAGVAGAGRWFGHRDGGASAHHDSKISLSAVMVSS